MKRRDALKNLGFISAIPFLSFSNDKKEVINNTEGYEIERETITITRTGKYVVTASVDFQNAGSAKGYIIIKRRNKFYKAVALFDFNGRPELNNVQCSGDEVLNLIEKDVISVYMKPKYLNIRNCYIKLYYVK